MKIRSERDDDEAALSALITRAFAGAEHSSGTEAAILSGLRAGSALTLSLVAEEEGRLLGQIAFSPVTISPAVPGWYGLGPVAVAPECQGQGIGAALVREGLARIRDAGAAGVVLLGDPAYYQRFGFTADAGLRLEGIPPGYFQALSFEGPVPQGEVHYHSAFSA